ncbi:hypothetical protein NZD88_17285 [Chryseobacterium antibioticum]|uniref:Uncharacterized protein n=1 Tax=Chryseobacterium pyrolae TaxID=2987481 RepID=A0ABT2IKX7_9FLAO|nr:hypothetical protein [Chryseobacterium pyrolae]MCT2409305.1 hypothetical protein [Chryseobacterium pyrolae]
MKKSFLFIVTVGLSIFSIKTNAQVGLNTMAPETTLDITAKNARGTTINVEGLLIPRVDRQRPQSMTSVPTSFTMIYVNSVATGAQTGTAVNIDTPGYYYSTAWVNSAALLPTSCIIG